MWRLPLCLCFFFQAGDGIRDAQESRGLGDVYKRQVEDHEIQTFARKSFEKQGIKILTNAKVTKLDKKSDSVTATIEEGGKTQTITAERVISAVGVTGNIENLGLEKLGLKTESGCLSLIHISEPTRLLSISYA